MDSRSAEPSTDYVNRLIVFSQEDPCGRAYRPLANFLRKGTQNRNGIGALDGTTGDFAHYYALYPSIQRSLTPNLDLSTLQDLDAHHISSGCGGRLIFLRGYPSPRWLSLLGYYYQIRPEYWRQHLEYLSPTDTFPSNTHVLPSTVGRIFQLSVGSIGTIGRWWKQGQRVKDLRRAAATDMVRYARDLGTGQGWKPADSVVRRYILHDKEHFSVEQTVTVYLHVGKNENDWIGKSSLATLQSAF